MPTLGLAAVANMRAAMLAARGPPTPSAESLAAIAETAAALADIREMQAPELKRAPRSEGRAAVEAEEASTVPTRESDTAHLTWQMRRALLCQRWGVVPVPGHSQVATEDTYCNALCGAALAQGGADVPCGAHGDAAWQVDLLTSLAPEGQQVPPREHLMAHRLHFAQLLSFARGGVLSLVKTACVKKHGGALGALGAGQVVWQPGPAYVQELLANLDYLQTAVGLSRSDLVSFLQRLPGSLNARVLKNLKSHGHQRPARPTSASELYKGSTLPPMLAGVVAVVTGIRVANGSSSQNVVVIHSVQGAPLFVSNGSKPSVRQAFENFKREQSHSATTNAQVRGFTDGALIDGDGVTPSDLGLSPQLANRRDPQIAAWYNTLCAPANAVRAALVAAGAETVQPGPTGSLGNVRVLAQIMCADIVRRSAVRHNER